MGGEWLDVTLLCCALISAFYLGHKTGRWAEHRRLSRLWDR